MPDYLVTYRPLIETKEGVEASKRYGLPPYIDASCRREPDLAHSMPAITALCRGHQFAPRLRVGDRAIYMTIKDRWDDSLDENCWKLVAALHVIHKPPSHEAAAAWYQEQGLPIPSNLLVAGNPPEPWERTSQKIRGDLRQRVPDPTANPVLTIRLWDGRYHLRARKYPGVAICRVIARSLASPPTLREQDFEAVLGHQPFARTPPRIGTAVADALIERLNAANEPADGRLHGVMGSATLTVDAANVLAATRAEQAKLADRKLREL